MNKVKKFFPRVLLAVVIITAVFGPWGAERVHAVNFLDFFGSSRDFVLSIFAEIANLFLKAVSLLVRAAAAFLDLSIDYSINRMGEFSSIAKSGWVVSRDIANLFFIFIILYIAIATILQLSTYGMKDLLVTVIIVALLVNFSLVFTNMIIDASNILASEFYDKVSNITWNQTNSKGEVVTTTNTTLSNALVQSMKLQTIFNGGDDIFEKIETNSVTEEVDMPLSKNCYDLNSNGKAVFESGNTQIYYRAGVNKCYKITTTSENKGGLPPADVLAKIFIVGIGGTIFLLVTAFALFAAGILFVTRLVILLLLMMLAPLAFLAMALPAISGYAKQWWRKLFDQSFFAPAYLFMIYLAVKLMAEGKLLDTTGANYDSFSAAFTNPDESNVKLILNFVIVIILMMASLIIAKQMGAVGASTVQGWGNKARGWATGKAGKLSRRGAGAIAEGMLDEKSWINEKTGGKFARFASLPIIGRGFAKVSSMKKSVDDKQRKEYEKQYDSYSDAGLAALMKDKTIISKTKKEALENIAKKRKDKERKKEELKEEKKQYEELTKVNKSTGKNKIQELEEEVRILEGTTDEKSKERERDIQLKLSILKQELSTEDNLKKQQEYVVELEQIKEKREELKEMKEEAKRLKDKFDLEDRFKEVEGKIGGGAEEKKKEEAKPKTK